MLSLLLQLNQEAMDLTVVELVPTDGDQFREQPAPRIMTSHQVTVPDVYGSLLYAGARTLQARLPEVAGTRAPAVVLRLRGRTSLGATFFRILAAYAEQLAAAGGRLYLSGLDPDMATLLARTGRVTVTSPVRDAGARPARPARLARPARPRAPRRAPLCKRARPSTRRSARSAPRSTTSRALWRRSESRVVKATRSFPTSTRSRERSRRRPTSLRP
ncbi:MAG: STAS domain-containing protein [Jiangellaceae bacterium]